MKFPIRPIISRGVIIIVSYFMALVVLVLSGWMSIPIANLGENTANLLLAVYFLYQIGRALLQLWLQPLGLHLPIPAWLRHWLWYMEMVTSTTAAFLAYFISPIMQEMVDVIIAEYLILLAEYLIIIIIIAILGFVMACSYNEKKVHHNDTRHAYWIIYS